MKVVKVGEVSVEELAQYIKKGKVIVLPTDTVYGLVALASNKKAVDKIFKIKNRDKNKYLPLFVKNLVMAKSLVYIDKEQEEYLNKVWPGKVTVVLKRKLDNEFNLYGVAKETLALRMPKDNLILKLIELVGEPLVETSANISGKLVYDITDILEQFEGNKTKPDLIIKSGKVSKVKPSKIVDLTKDEVKVLRS